MNLGRRPHLHLPSRAACRLRVLARRCALIMSVVTWVVLLAGAPLSARERTAGGVIRVDTIRSMQAGRVYPALVEIRNAGPAAWMADGPIRLTYRWWTSDGRLVGNGQATRLPRDVGPGESVTLCQSVRAPEQAGAMRLQWILTEHAAVTLTPSPGDESVRSVVVEDASRFGTVWAIVRLSVFGAVTLAHFALVVVWLRLFRHREAWDADDFAFASIVVGLGSFLAILDTVAFTVGLSLGRGLLAFTIAHVSVAVVWVVRHRNRRWSGAVPGVRLEAPGSAPLTLAVAGVVIVLSVVIEWTLAAARSAHVTGADAAHYHVPYAVDIALGANPFGLPATPHLYPMGTSVLAAWFILPFQDLLLVDLAILLPFLLGWFAITRLIRELSGRSGLTWGPWCALLLLSTPLVRSGLLMSADLFYTSAFLAVNAILLTACVRLRVDTIDVLCLGLAIGMLAGTKATGPFSAAALVAVYGAILIGRALIEGRTLERAGIGAVRICLAILLAIAAGGVWLLRNWWCFGSPLAPSGLSLFGFTVFPGGSYRENMYYLSVLRDIRDGAQYNVGARLVHWLHEWFGTWFLLSGVPIAVFGIDLVRGGKHTGGNGDRARARAMFALGSAVLIAVHLVLLAGVPWSSLEWTHGFSLRYALPCFILLVLIAYAALFPMSFSWLPSRRAGWAGLLALLAVVWYVAHQGAPGVPIDESVGRITPFSLLAAFVVGAIGFGVARARGGWRRASAAAAMVAVLAAGYAAYAVPREIGVRQSAEGAFDRMAVCKDGGGEPISNYRGAYLALLDWERATATVCPSRRIFTTTRWDAPLDLQSPLLLNQVFDVRGGTVLSRMLRRARPGSRPCEYLIASAAELDTRRGVPLLNLLKTRTAIKRVAEHGPYVVFAAW